MVVEALMYSHTTPQTVGAAPWIVTVAGPVAAVLLAVSVNALEPVVGFVPHAAVTPLGRFKAVRVTAPAKPQLPVTETVLDVLSP
jgi:hypothetical protein